MALIGLILDYLHRWKEMKIVSLAKLEYIYNGLVMDIRSE